jgi:hypothetical protein
MAVFGGQPMRRRARFVIKVHGIDRQVIAVSESTRGDLSVIPYVGSTSDHPIGVFETDTTKISVHISPSSTGYTIKHYTRYSNGEHVDQAIFIEDGKANFFWPLESRFVSNRDLERYIRQPTAKDTVIGMGAYDPAFSTLAHCTLVADAGRTIPSTIMGLNVYTHRFSVFQIAIITFFVPLPSTRSGGGLIFGADRSRWNNSPIAPLEKGVKSISLDEMPTILLSSLMQIGPKILHHLSRTIMDGPPPPEIVAASRRALPACPKDG